MKIAIIGAGLTGLTTAYRLSQKKEKVVVFEKEKSPGGLTAGFKRKNWDWSCEWFFHHLFTSDDAAKQLISELGLENKLFFTRPKTSIFYAGKVSQFDSPVSVLKFPHLSLSEKMITGKATAYLRLANNWHKFEKIPASFWLAKNYGKKPYQILWEPLLKSKFGDEAENISLAWFWARIKKRSAKLGYLKGSFQILIEALIKNIKKNKGQIILNNPIGNLKEINKFGQFDQVIITTPVSTVYQIIPELPADYQRKLKSLKMIGAISLILILKEKFLKDETYWLNINSSGFPFVAVVEHTNFINPKHYDDNHLLYVGGYYSPAHPYFQMSKRQIFRKFLPYLKKINPQFDFQNSIINLELCSNKHAQPIVPINYSQIIPSYQTPIPGVYLANMQMVYPWDRGINYAVKMGEEIANIASSS